MSTPIATIIPFLLPFAMAFTDPTFRKVCVLVAGTLLAPGRRTVCAALSACSLRDTTTFGKYHRVLNRDRWSPMLVSRLLVQLLVAAFVPPGAPLLLAGDETLERRRGKQIAYKGLFRDPIRSTRNQKVFAWGIRWFCVALLVPVPWSARLWALPFWVVPVLSEKTCARLGKAHRSSVAWAQIAVAKVARWFPERRVIFVGDGGFAAIEFVASCQQRDTTQVVARLRLDAALYRSPGPQPPGKRGPKPKKGAREPNLAQRLADPQTRWQQGKLRWYGGQEKQVEIATGVALWYTRGKAPVPIRWVLVRPVAGDKEPFEPAALLGSDPAVTAAQLLEWFVQRWNIEVTFEEMRAQLGLETQRQWTTRAIGRTTPCLFGLFSLVVWMAHHLYPHGLPRREAGWYPKQEATFSDVLGAVRWHLWGGEKYPSSPEHPDWCLIPVALLQGLRQVACYST